MRKKYFVHLNCKLTFFLGAENNNHQQKINYRISGVKNLLTTNQKKNHQLIYN